MLKFNSQTSTRLNRQGTVMVKAKSLEKDALGQYPIVDTKVCTVWVGVIPQTGSMLSGRTAETVLTRTTHKVVMRYRDDIRPEMWIVIDGVRYDILYILDPYLHHEVLEIFCEVKDFGRNV